MPILNLRMAPLQAAGLYAGLAEALTEITVRTLGKRRELTAVVIEDLPAAQWTVGGHSVQRPTALLEINITAGSNSAEQKAAFVHAAYAALQQQLGPSGPLEEASYVIVRELPAGDWGYGGSTQEERKATLRGKR
jgi:4-oxalocrotonate tautomerase